MLVLFLHNELLLPANSVPCNLASGCNTTLWMEDKAKGTQVMKKVKQITEEKQIPVQITLLKRKAKRSLEITSL